MKVMFGFEKLMQPLGGFCCYTETAFCLCLADTALFRLTPAAIAEFLDNNPFIFWLYKHHCDHSTEWGSVQLKNELSTGPVLLGHSL